jgi:hypothetical protein
VHLLPNYDELLIAYRDRSDATDPALAARPLPFPFESLIAHIVVVRGLVRGGWKRRRVRGGVVVEVGPLDDLGAAESKALRGAIDRYGRFLGVPMEVTGLPG